MKKLTATLLALVMILSMIPSIAFAYELGSVSILAEEPVAGATPNFSVTCNHDTYYVDTQYGSVMDYFEIFMARMILCRKAADKLGLEFKLIINEQQLI